MKSTLIYSAIIFAVFIGITSAASPFTMNIVSNTIYQNTNSTPLAIYAIAQSSSLRGYLGNPASLTKVIDLRGGSITITGAVYPLTGYNMSAYMLVEPQEYYKFNFTNATFRGQYLPKSSSSLAIIPQEVVSVSSINLYALLPFGVGLILGLLGAIMPWGWYRKSLFLIIGATLVLIGGMLTIIPVPLAQVESSTVNVTSSSGNYFISAYNSTISQPVLNASWGFIYEAAYALIAVLFAILAVVFVLMGKKANKNGNI
jgi:hypothetical protein